MFGSRLTYIALFWWVLGKTGSAATLAGVATATALPYFFGTDRRGVRRSSRPLEADAGDESDKRPHYRDGGWRAVGRAALGVGDTCVHHLCRHGTAFHRPSLQASIANLVQREQRFEIDLFRYPLWLQISLP